MVGITRKPLFWILFTLTSLASCFFTIRYFHKAFPIVHLELGINRSDALQRANNLAKNLSVGPKEFHQATSFNTDNKVKTFVELDAGGKDAFAKMLKQNYYKPYTWSVRHFKESEKHEATFNFTPDGTPYGFIETISENTPGAELLPHQAQVVAEKNAQQHWNVKLHEYKLIETSKKVQPSKRVDHTFVYERPHVKIGKGLYRLKLVVSGKRLTQVSPFVKVPEEFTLRYKEMRSQNNTIATAANFLMMLLYFAGGCIFGLIWLLRKRVGIWKTPLLWGVFIGLLQAAIAINQLPLAWMSYDTALSMQTFFMQYITIILATIISMTLFNAIIYMAAEGLTRQAFGNQIQLWKVWSTKAAHSVEILGRTIGGYLLVPFMLAFVVLFYLITTTFFGWWTPSSELINPNILATYAPWFSSIAISLQAGFMEECLFRAIPLASATLLGKRFGKPKLWVGGAFILQALIFGAAHANYPAQPAYARLVELIFPSFVWGGVYLTFGLLPSIIAHFAYDVVWFALPLFVSTASNAWINQLIVILLALIPIWIVVYARIRTGAWSILSLNFLNRSWIPVPEKPVEHIEYKKPKSFDLTKTIKMSLVVLCALGITLSFISIKYHQDTPMFSLSRDLATKNAVHKLNKEGIRLSKPWEPLTAISPHFNYDYNEKMQQKFIWQNGDKNLYKKLLGTYLKPPYWTTRFVRFAGSVSERSEEYQISNTGNGKLLSFNHKLPETSAGAKLSEEDARIIAHTSLQKNYKLTPQEIKEISAVANKYPERKDWTFIFANQKDSALKKDEARIMISIGGDKITNRQRYIHVPEEWERQERNHDQLANILSTLCNLLLYLILGFGIFMAIRKTPTLMFSKKTFLVSFLLLISAYFLKMINAYPTIVFRFNTSEPFPNQLFMAYGMSAISILFSSASYAFIISLITGKMRTYRFAHKSEAVLAGLSTGLFASGLHLILKKHAPSLQPTWAEYISFGAFYPTLSTIINTILSWLSVTCLIMLAVIICNAFSDHWKQRKIITLGLLIILGVVTTGLTPALSISYWMYSGIITGTMFVLLYILLLRFDHSFLPIATGIYASMFSLQQIIFNLHPTESSTIINTLFALTQPLVWGHIAALLLIFVLSATWYKRLRA